MSSWVAVCFGALAVPEEQVAGAGYEYVVTPVIPAEPRLLFGDGAALWRRLLSGPIDDADLSPGERHIVHEMDELGLASSDPTHPARIGSVSNPWLVSAHHELVYALLAHVAALHEIDIVFIKGPTLFAQGLRTRAHSGDVDCWVRMGDESRLALAMAPWGWVPAFSAFTGTRVLHSLTLRAGPWGCAIDVHSWFPGMTLEPQHAFDLALRSSEERSFASRSVKTPAIGLHAVMAALHEMRPIEGRPASDAQLSEASRTLGIAGGPAADAVRRVGAQHALKDALPSAFPDEEFDLKSAAIPADWAWRLQSTQLGVYKEALKLIPWQERPRVLFRIIWPSKDTLRLSAGDEHPTRARSASLRLRHVIELVQKAARRHGR